MARFRILIFIATTIMSMCTQIQSQNKSEEPYNGRLGPGLNCPLGLDTQRRLCEVKAAEVLNNSDSSKRTVLQQCRLCDEEIKCTNTAMDSCKSQKAQVAKVVIEVFTIYQYAAFYDCKTLNKKGATPSAGRDADGRECSYTGSTLECIKGTSQGVSGTVDYSAIHTFAQHCKNRDDLIKCFYSLKDTCMAPVAADQKVALVIGAYKAYIRFQCAGEAPPAPSPLRTDTMPSQAKLRFQSAPTSSHFTSATSYSEQLQCGVTTFLAFGFAWLLKLLP